MRRMSPPHYFFPLGDALFPLSPPPKLEYFDTVDRLWRDIPNTIRDLATPISYGFEDIRAIVSNTFQQYEGYPQEGWPLDIIAHVTLAIKVLSAKRETSNFYSTGWRGFAQRLVEKDFRATVDAIRSGNAGQVTHTIDDIYHLLSILYCLDEMDLLTIADYRSIARFILSKQLASSYRNKLKAAVFRHILPLTDPSTPAPINSAG